MRGCLTVTSVVMLGRAITLVIPGRAKHEPGTHEHRRLWLSYLVSVLGFRTAAELVLGLAEGQTRVQLPE